MAEKEQKERKGGQGEGSIYQRNNGRWIAAVITDYKDGKLKRKSSYGKTRKEVADKLTTELNNQQTGLPPVNDRLTIAQYFLEISNGRKVQMYLGIVVLHFTFKGYADAFHNEYS
jgi:hypothetical protein